MSELLRTLLAVFAPLSLLTIGGGQSVVADIQRQVVDVHHWMTAREFVDLFAISRMTPGPGSLLATSDRLARGRLLGRYRCHNRHIRADGISDFRPCAYLEAIFRCALATGSRNGSETGRCWDDPGVCLCPDPDAGWGLAGAAARDCLDRRAYDDAGEPICGDLGGHGDFHFPACGRAGLIDRLRRSGGGYACAMKAVQNSGDPPGTVRRCQSCCKRSRRLVPIDLSR